MSRDTKIFAKTLAFLFTVICIIGIYPVSDSYAAESRTSIAGKVYSFGEKDHYEYSSAGTSAPADDDNAYGHFSISGKIKEDGVNGEFPSFFVESGNVSLTYSYTDKLLTADEASWHIVKDSSKQVDEIKLDSDIDKGALVLLTSKDGKT